MLSYWWLLPYILVYRTGGPIGASPTDALQEILGSGEAFSPGTANETSSYGKGATDLTDYLPR